MIGEDDGGILDRFTGSSIDEEEIWSEVRQDGKSLKNRSQKLQANANTLRATDANDIADPTDIAEHAEEAAEHAMNVSEGANVAVNANNEAALNREEAYEIIESVHVKVEGLTEDLTETYEEVIEYGEETYEQFHQLLDTDMGLGVDVELPLNMDWNSGEVEKALRDVESSYETKAREYSREAQRNHSEQEKAEDKAEKYREIQEDLGDSIFEEEYGEIADTLEEKAESDEPVTAAEKAEKAESYAAIAEFAREHIGNVKTVASNIEKAEEKAYQASENLASLLRNEGYSRENEAAEWRRAE